MSILSVTFHTTESRLGEWDKYCMDELINRVENLNDVDKYILSDVDSSMLGEGRNTNLFLVFENEALRSEFLLGELPKIADQVDQVFGQDVMIFPTLLNPKKLRY